MATINFDSQFYLGQKLAQLQEQDAAQYGDWTTDDVQNAFDEAGLTAEQHYENYGYIEGLSPNAQFDSTAYLQDKLAQLQEAGEDGFETIADVANAFQASGLSPLEHYNQYGQDEGLTATPVADAGNGGDEDNGGGPTAPTPSTDIQFDSSEKDGTTVTVDGDGKLQLSTEAQGDTVKHIGKAEYDETGTYNTTADYSFTLSNQLNYDGVDQYEGTFLSPLMVESGGIGQGAVLDLRFADRLAPANDQSETLNNTQINLFDFTLNGTEYQVNDDNTDGLLSQARAYPELLEAIQTGIDNLKAGNPELSVLSMKNGSTFTVDQYDEADNLTGENVKGTSIILSASEGELGGFSANVSSAGDGGVDSYARAFDETTDGVEGLIQTTLNLDNIGYGSQGGSVNLAGESNSNVGIEKFNVNVENGVWLTELSSADTANNSEFNHLKVVDVNGTDYFRVGQQSQSWGHSNTAGEYFTANGQTANWVSPFVADTAATDQGLTDVQHLDLTGITGANAGSAVNARITDNVIDRDLDLVDVNGKPANDNVEYSYELTGGDDVLNMSVSADVLEREDFELAIDTDAGNDAGNDVVHLQNDLEDDSSALTNQQLNGNVSIDTGAGNDRVWSEGNGDATITTGAGDDLIFADNSGDQGIGSNEGRAQFVFNNETANIRDLESNSDVNLSNGANGTAQSFTVTGLGTNATSGTVGVKVNFMGFEATANIDIAGSSISDSGEASISALQINQALKSAINGDDVLKELLLAKDGNGNALVVDSKIDGQMTADDLDISFSGEDADGNAYTFPTALTTGDVYDTEFAQDGTDVTGADSDAESDNVINAGTGTDEIVLGTGANSNDTVAFTGSNNGVDSIVNFTDGALGDTGSAGADILDFTSYLQSTDVNGDAIDTKLNDDTTAEADSVTVQGFGGAVDGADFAGLNAANLLAALNGDDNSTDYAGISGADLSAAAIANDASDGNYVVMFQSDSNAGEYKAFNLTASAGTDDGDFDSAQLIGTMDFGSKLTNLHVDNLA
ncbi:beta strand repeat-containing protein [Chromohalobacter japonicus]|uniref:beta strand repeat-containing protein n=1 Tax=Chromohalobacter japonicus TaxID=223900 RepID=UPI003F8EE1BF